VRESGKPKGAIPDNKFPPTTNMGNKLVQMPLDTVWLDTLPVGTTQGYIQRTHFGSVEIQII
jgi:hypothetical protein